MAFHEADPIPGFDHYLDLLACPPPMIGSLCSFPDFSDFMSLTPPPSGLSSPLNGSMGTTAPSSPASCLPSLLSLDDHIHIEDHLGGHLSSQLAPDHDEEFTQELDFFLSGQNYHHTVFKMEPGEEEEGEDAVSVSKRRSDDDGDESANKRHSLSNDITSEAFPPLSSLSDSLWMPMMSLPALRPLAQETRAAAKERKSSPNEPRTGAQRERHSELERQRRDELKQAFDNLCSAVPVLSLERSPTRPPPQAQILNKALEYITSLRQRHQDLLSHKDQLQQQRMQLETRLCQLSAYQ